MTIAEINGKLSPDRVHDRSEDLLTSDVFGTMSFVGDADPFLAWLAQAVCVLDIERTLAAILPTNGHTTTKVRFWPRLANGREPDVALLEEANEGKTCLIVVEVKYESGLSNFDVDPAGEESDDKLSGHQLVDQIAGMKQTGIGGLCSEWFGKFDQPGEAVWCHLFITCDRSVPQEAYAEVFSRFGKRPDDYTPTGQPLPFWLSWHKLLPTLKRVRSEGNATDRRLFDHLIDLLTYKQLGAVSFNAFQQLPCPELSSSPSFWNHQNWLSSAVGGDWSPGAFDSYRTWWRTK